MTVRDPRKYPKKRRVISALGLEWFRSKGTSFSNNLETTLGGGRGKRISDRESVFGG